MDISSPAGDRPPSMVSAQRRYLTLLFCDISGSSELAERLEPEEYAELIQHFRRHAREVIPRHGGSIARLQGDGLLALFGHRQTREDDGRRAAAAAFELHAAVAQLRVGGRHDAPVLQLHSGIHGGLLLMIEGDIELGRFDVFGEAPNTAARLCSMAAPGEILASTEILGPQAHFFAVSQPWRVPIRGRAEPLGIVRIEGRAEVARRIDAAALRGVVPLVGRRAALAELAAAAERVASRGETAVMLVAGEPGIGKTRIIEEFLAGLDEQRFRALKGYCEGYLGAQPLQPFMHWLRAAFGWRADASAEMNEARVTAALAALPGERGGDDAAIVRALAGGSAGDGSPAATLRVAAITGLIAALARERTLVLVLDDWQWADDASRHALEQLRARRLPLLLLLASRPTTDDDHLVVGARTLNLEPLDAADAQRAVAAWLPDAEPFVAQEIVNRAGGSPLFIEELCHAAAAGTDFAAAPKRVGVAWLNALVASRLSRLPAAHAEFLRVASVAGNVFAAALVERLADNAGQLFEALERQDFLVPAGQPGMLRFKHALTREAVYATVDAGRRRALHRHVAESLEAAGGAENADALEALAYHWDAAGVPDKAVRHAEAAGDRALGAMALDRARALFITALRALDTLPELPPPLKLRWCAIAQKLGQTCVFDPLDVAHSFVLFARAAQLARETGERNALARAQYWLGYVSYGKGRPRDAVHHCEAALEGALATDDQRLAAQVRATLAQALASAGRYERAMPLFAAAVEERRAGSQPGSRGAIGQAYTLGRMAYTYGDLGRFDEAHAVFAESLHLLGDQLHSVAASVRELIGAVHLWQGRWDEAQAAALQGAEIALRCRSRYLTAMGRALAACGAWAARGDTASLQSLRESTHWIELRGGAVSTSLNYGWLVEATLALGLVDEARQHGARLFMRARAQDRHGQAQGCRALARWAAASGNAARAQHYLARADDAARLRGSPREQALNDLARAEIAAAAGRPAEARALAERAGEALAAMGMAWHLARANALLRH